VISQQILDPHFYKKLKADFPRIEHQRAPLPGSRVGKGRGFDIYRGDEAYDELLATSEAWAKLDAWINSPAFVEKFNETFGPDLDHLKISGRIDPSEYRRELVEPRSQLSEKRTVWERAACKIHKRLPSNSKAVPLFTRLDIEKSTSGYSKRPHCDRANRLCSLIIYFCDANERGLEGGELQLFEHVREQDIDKMPRYPKTEEVREVARLKPSDNLGVFFPCSNNSYHGVTKIVSDGKERDFLYINISGDVPSLWQ
jgi:hypothetical protein